MFVEHVSGAPVDTSLQAITAAGTLGEVSSVSVGSCQIGGVSRRLQIEHPILSDYAPEAIGEAIAQLVGAESPDVLLAAGTERGNEVMAHVAARLDLPLASNVTEIRPDGEDWELTRVRWGGSLLEDARLSAPIKLATIALHVFGASAPMGEVPTETFTPDLPS